MELYINNQLVDLDNTVNFPLRYSIEDSINPTIIKTPHSKTISLPNTSNNNIIFGHYARFDKVIGLIDINPNEKIPFILLHNNELIMKGYAKLDNINNGRFNINLFSEIGDLLRNLDEKKLYELCPSVPFKVNKSTVANLLQTNPADTTLDPIGVSRYLWHYTFVPSYQGNYPNFNSSKVLSDSNKELTLTTEYDEHTQRDFRSYYQKPALYINKLVQSIATFSNIKLHEDFHNNQNKYWNNGIMVFPKLIPDSEIQSQNNEIEQQSLFNYNADTNVLNGTSLIKVIDQNDTYNIIQTDGKFNLTNFPNDNVVVDYEVDLSIDLSHTIIINSPDFNYYLGPNVIGGNAGYIRISIWVEGQTNSANEFLYYGHRLTDYANTNCLGISITNNNKITFYDSAGNATTTKKFRCKSVFSNNNISNWINVKIEALSAGYTPLDFVVIGVGKQDDYKIIADYGFSLTQKSVVGSIGNITFGTPKIIRSNYIINYKNILPDNIKASDFLLEYIKMFGLVLWKDPTDDKYILSTRNTFYSSGSSDNNWDDKLDPEKDIIIRPLNYDSRYYTLDFEKSNTTHYENYSKVISKDIPYGSTKIDTGYKFDTEPKKMFSTKANVCMISQEYDYYYDTKDLVKWYRKDSIFPTFCNLENGTNKRTSSDFTYTYMFRDGRVSIPKYESNYPIERKDKKTNYIIVTDDSDNMILEDEYYYVYDDKKAPNTSGDNKILVKDGTNLPIHPWCRDLDKTGRWSFHWSKPEEAYYELDDTFYDKNGTLYSRFYDRYITDRFDINTKVVEAYFNIKYTDLNNRLNDFIFFRGMYWIINEIEEYDLTKNDSVKIKLISVNDRLNYTEGQLLT